MKKILAFALAAIMVTSLAACGKKDTKPTEDDKPSISEQQGTTEPTSEEGTTEGEIQGDPVEYGREFWEAKYPNENICPFTIEENGKEYDYYWVSSLEGWDGTIESWLKQPFNWNGWHKTADGCIVNKDETLKITDDWASGEGMSSFCTITTEKYTPTSAADATQAS